MTRFKSIAEKICFVSNTRKKSLAVALYDSILDEDLNEIEFLLKEKRADPNYLLLEYGISPLHCSIGVGCEDHAFKVVSFILCYGGDPNVRCSEGSTPVLIASLWGRLHILKLLLINRGDPLLTDENGLNALDYAYENNHRSLLTYLKGWNNNCNVIFSSPSTCRNDAITQTSFLSEKGHVSESPSDSISSDFISCNDLSNSDFLNEIKSPCVNDRIPTPESTLSNVLLTDFTPSKSNNNCSDLDKGFIYNNLSDLLSDVDSDIDLENTVSFYCPNSNISDIEKSLGMVNNTDENISKCVTLDKEKNNEPNLKESSDIFNKIFKDNVFDVNASSFESCHSSMDPLDAAFIVENIDVERKPNEALYTDDEAGVVLLQRNFPPNLSDNDSNCVGTKLSGSNISHCSTEFYDTDHLTNKLKAFNIFSGPITKTTKKVYARQLKRFIKSECTENGKVDIEIGSVLSRTFSKNFLKLIEQWTSLETNMSNDFLKDPIKFKFRGGTAKCFFNYLLMDPSVTDNLPLKVNSMQYLDVWRIFLKAIFYVGKGKQSRPYAHLYEALKPNTRKPLSKKITKVLDIWNNKQGVVCLMIFHNTISAEALTREAAMIDVMPSGHLTNAQGGEYHGVAATWNMKQKCQLGAVLLHRALTIYLAEGERQISPPDLESRPTFR